MTSLHVIYGLGPPIKNLGYAYGPRTQKNPRLRTALLRTDPFEMLEAKAKDQGHWRKCSPKKIFFWAVSKKKVFKNFFASARVT